MARYRLDTGVTENVTDLQLNPLSAMQAIDAVGGGFGSPRRNDLSDCPAKNWSESPYWGLPCLGLCDLGGVSVVRCCICSEWRPLEHHFAMKLLISVRTNILPGFKRSWNFTNERCMPYYPYSFFGPSRPGRFQIFYQLLAVASTQVGASETPSFHVLTAIGPVSSQSYRQGAPDFQW